VVSEGNLLSTGGGTLLTTVVQVNPMWVRFSVSQAELNAAMPGGRFKPQAVRGVELVMPDGSTYPVRGKLNFAASQINPSLGTCSCAASSPTRTAPCCPASSCAPACSPANATASSRCRSAVMQTDKGVVVMLAAPTTRSSRGL
jgi:membrane fusion protein (multidrug efflux system)